MCMYVGERVNPPGQFAPVERAQTINGQNTHGNSSARVMLSLSSEGCEEGKEREYKQREMGKRLPFSARVCD